MGDTKRLGEILDLHRRMLEMRYSLHIRVEVLRQHLESKLQRAWARDKDLEHSTIQMVIDVEISNFPRGWLQITL